MTCPSYTASCVTVLPLLPVVCDSSASDVSLLYLQLCDGSASLPVVCDSSASDAFRAMKELHQMLMAEKLYNDAKEYWTKVFDKHGEKASWEGESRTKLTSLQYRCNQPERISASLFSD